MSGQLVEQWPLKPLSELCEFRRGLTYKKGDQVELSSTPVLRATNISLDSNALILDDLRYISDDFVVPENKRVIPESILMCIASGSKKHLGKVAFVENIEPLAFGGFMGLLVPKSEVYPKYLYYSLISPMFKDWIAKLSDGTNINNLNFSKIENFQICLPPLDEQQRIVSILDEAFNRLAISGDQLNQKILNASEIYQTSLSSIFAENENWESGCLGDVTGGVQTGPFGSLLHKSDYIANGIPIVNPAHITETGIMPDKNKTISVETAGRLSNYLLKPQYVVIGRRGEMGRCAVVNEKENGWLCGTGSFFIKPSEQIDSHFLVKLLWSERYRTKLNEIATGATMKNLNNKALSNLVIEFPSITEQQEIISRLDSVYSEIEMLKQTLSVKSEYLDELKQSILQEAFSGTLRIAEGLADQS